MTANIITAIGVALIVGSAIFGGGSNGAAEFPAAGPSVPPARLFVALGSVTRPTATPYTAVSVATVSSIEDGRVWSADAPGCGPAEWNTTRAGGCLVDVSATTPQHPALPLSIEALICAMPWPCQQALAVAWCESRMDPAATNGAHIGVFQLSSRYHGWRLGEGESFFDAGTNIRVAFSLYQESGWPPWAACR